MENNFDDFEFDTELIEEYLDDDEITAQEAGFMRGYNQIVKRKAHKARQRDEFLRKLAGSQNG